VSVIALVLTGCNEPAAQVETLKKFHVAGVSFDYPGNWFVRDGFDSTNTFTADAPDIARPTLLFVESPGSMLISLTFLDDADMQSIDEYAREHSSEVKEETPFLTNAIEYDFGKVQSWEGYETVHVKSKDTFLYVFEMPFTSLYHRKNFEGTAVMANLYLATEDLNQVRLGYEQVLKSLKITPHSN